MKHGEIILRILVLVVFGAVLGACATTGKRPALELDEPVPRLTETRLTQAVSDFGVLLRAYPSRRPFLLDDSIVLEIEPILNYSGEDGLPPDFSTVLTTIVSSVGLPIAPKPPISFREREVEALGRMPRLGPEPDLTIRGSVTEGEKWFTSEYATEMDALFEDSERRDSVDVGGTIEGGNEVRTLALDLHLVEKSGLVVEAVSHRVDVVRRGRSSSFGVFFRGSGIGFRARKLIAQTNSQALRIAAQQSVMVLLGRYFRVPYWRALPGSEPDQALVDAYRATLESGEAPEDFRLLLFAHGVDIDFDSYTFSDSEIRAVTELKSRLDLPVETSHLDLALHLWLTAPLRDSPLARLRIILRAEGFQPPSSRSTFSFDSLLGMISQLRPGQELYIPVFFDYDFSSLSEPAKTRIDLLVEALRTSGRFDGDWWIELRGHSDERGEPLKLQELSDKRAERVRSYLEQEHSVPADRIVSAGFGSTEPVIEDPRSEEEYSQNRRVEILLVAGSRTDTQP